MRPVPLPALLFAAVAVAQEPTCRLEGQVVDPMQLPVANAEVTASFDGDVVARTRADGSGQFVFGRLPQRVVSVVARAPGPDVGAAWLDLLGLPVQFARIVTMPAREVRGVVRDDNGSAVGGAWVLSMPLGDEPIAVAATLVQADAAGAFTLTHVPFGRNLLRAWAPDHDAFEDRLDGAEDLQVECTVTTEAKLERVFRCEGTAAHASDHARLLVAATYRTVPLPLPPPLRRPAAKDGVWRLRGWPLDEVTARVVLDGGSATPPVRVVPAYYSGGEQEFRVADRDENFVSGQLHGSDLVGGTWLVAVPMAADGQRTFARTRADGTFALPAPVAAEGQFAIRVLSPELAVHPTEGDPAAIWWVGNRRSDLPVDLDVHTAMQVRLRVLAADGAAAAGAVVQLFAMADDQMPAQVTPRDLDPRTVIASGCTGLDGRLELGGLAVPASAQVQCLVENDAGWTCRSFAPHAGAVADLGDLVPSDGGTIEITAVDASGAPFAGACLQLRVCHAWEGTARRIVCDRQGRARLLGMSPDQVLLSSGDEGRIFTPLAGQVTVVELRACNRR